MGTDVHGLCFPKKIRNEDLRHLNHIRNIRSYQFITSKVLKQVQSDVSMESSSGNDATVLNWQLKTENY